MGSVSYGLGADLSLSPSLPVGDDRYLNLTKVTHGPKSRGKSFGTTLWHHVQRYCCIGVLFAHVQVASNSSYYHIRGNEMNWLESRECKFAVEEHSIPHEPQNILGNLSE